MHTKPLLILAPMEDVTDSVFRQVICYCGKPDLFFTEFISVNAILSKGFDKVKHRLQFTEQEKPIICQLWGNDPNKFIQASKIVEDLGFAGIDINMGCPVKKVVNIGCGGGLIKTPDLACEIIYQTQKSTKLPVSVKTRIGFNEIITKDWISKILTTKPSMLTVHCRTVKEQSKVKNHWDEMSLVVDLKNNISKDTKIIGNGDITTYDQALEISEKYKLDGVMIGRGIFNDPWIFNPKNKPIEEDVSNSSEFFNLGSGKTSNISRERIKLLKMHIQLFEDTWKNCKSFNIMKKFCKMYIQNFEGATDLREKLMQTKNAKEVIEILENIDLK